MQTAERERRKQVGFKLILLENLTEATSRETCFRVAIFTEDSEERGAIYKCREERNRKWDF